MPGGRGKPKRACKLCKYYKYLGNAKERYSERETARRKATKQEMKQRDEG